MVWRVFKRVFEKDLEGAKKSRGTTYKGDLELEGNKFYSLELDKAIVNLKISLNEPA